MRGSVALLGLLGFLQISALSAQDHGRWRFYRALDGLPEDQATAVTLGARGQVWVKQSPGKPIALLDGYSVRSINPAVVSSSPVYESRSGQLWCTVQDGLMEYRRDQWIRHPVAEIRALAQVEGGRIHRSIPLLPVERDHVMILLPDRLIEFDARQSGSTLIRSAAEEGMGRFVDMVEGRDGVLWVAAEGGITRVPGPIRRLGTNTIWESFALPAGLDLAVAGRPFEDEEGGVTAVGRSLVGTNRWVLHFDGRAWTRPLLAPGETRFAWRVPGESFWAASPASLHRWWNGEWREVALGGTGEASIHDVAVDYSGVFWLATSAGVARRAALTWNLPADAPAVLSTPCRAIVEDRANHVWFACAGGLARLTGSREWWSHSWPADWPEGPRDGARMAALTDGRVLVEPAPGEGVRVFDASGGSSTPLPGGAALWVGEVAPGVVCLVNPQAGPGRDVYQLFDGNSAKPFPAEALARWPEPSLQWVAPGADGTWWIAGFTNLALWHERQQRFQLLNSPSLEPPLSLLDRGRGRSWFARGGVIAEHNGRSWTLVRGGLGRVNALVEAKDGGVWIATSQTLYRFLEGSWVDDGVDEGLPRGGISDVLETRAGAVWAATTGGARLYRREADLDPPLAEIFADDAVREVTVGRTAELPIRGRDRWHYTPAPRLVYSWRLDDGPWSAFDRLQSVTVSNLASGRHLAAVRAMDRNWNVQPEAAVFELEAIVPWYGEPRIVVVALGGLMVALALGWLAINRHLQLRRSYAEVGRIVAQRTQELERANAELLHSQKMRALGTLAAGIAHDFNSILSIIKGSAQIIGANPDDQEKVRTRLSRINAMVDQGSGIVRALLGFVRPREGDERPLELNAFVHETVKLVADQASPVIRFHFEPDPALPMTRARVDLLRQVLMNLLFNAADAITGPGEVRLSTRALDRLPSGLVLPPSPAPRYARIDVGDTGHGIDPEILPRIFEPFFTTKAMSTRRGTGLGLTMVYEIAKDNGYGLAVESVPGEGATFRVFLPLTDPDPAIAQPPG